MLLLCRYIIVFLFVLLFVVCVVTARIAVVKPTGSPIICKTDEVGELVIQSPATGSAYWGLSGKTSTTFKVISCC